MKSHAVFALHLHVEDGFPTPIVRGVCTCERCGEEFSVDSPSQAAEALQRLANHMFVCKADVT